MQLLGHDRGAGRPRHLGHRAETSAASSSQAARRAWTRCSTIYGRNAQIPSLCSVPTCSVGMSLFPWTLTSESLCVLLLLEPLRGTRPRALLALLGPTAQRRLG